MAPFQPFADRWNTLLGIRDPWMHYWQQLTEILIPGRADFTRRQERGKQREVAIYDGTPRLAMRDLASTLDGLIKPKTSHWFDGAIDDDLEGDDSVKIWYEIVRERMWKAIYRTDARFIQRSGEVDLMLSALGWGVLWIQENRRRDGLLFRSFHNSQCAIDENEDGIIDTIGIQENFNARQAAGLYRRLGKDIPSKIAEELKKSKPTAVFPFVQLVLPRDDRNARFIGAEGMPFVSVVIDLKSETVVSETGFQEFPCAVPRWDTAPNEIYARSPGMMALPDAKTLQAMGKTLLVGGQRAVDPPIWVLNDSVMSPLRTFPGGITVLDNSDAGGGAPVGSWPVSTNIPLGRDMQEDYRAKVEAAFFKNVFSLPIQGQQMTATEILERKEEFIRAIGPVFGRLEADYVGHIVERVFGIMERAGAFPPRPDALEGRNVDFRFQSPIQQARKQVEIAGLSRAMELLEPLAAAQPEIMDNFDGDQISRDVPDWAGMPNRWLRPIEDRDALREQRAQQQSQAQQAEMAEPETKAIRNLADAEAKMAAAA